eukprot:scaffold16011_cov126-Isochrysis_galbana.AAC.3
MTSDMCILAYSGAYSLVALRVLKTALQLHAARRAAHTTIRGEARSYHRTYPGDPAAHLATAACHRHTDISLCLPGGRERQARNGCTSRCKCKVHGEALVGGMRRNSKRV